MECAKLFSQGDFSKALDLYPWPLYSALIAATHKTTSMSLLHSAQTLQVIFFALSVYSFIELIKAAGGGRLAIILGGLMFFSSPYIVGISLEMLLRDQGFIAFLLLAIVFLQTLVFIKHYLRHCFGKYLLFSHYSLESRLYLTF